MNTQNTDPSNLREELNKQPLLKVAGHAHYTNDIYDENNNFTRVCLQANTFINKDILGEEMTVPMVLVFQYNHN